MADGLENDGLRQRVAAARASAGAAVPIHPTPPADELASFWAKPGVTGVAPQAPPPPPIRVADRIKKKAAATPVEKNGKAQALLQADGTRLEKCTKIVNSLLEAWVKESKTSSTKANSNLASGLMYNGAALIHAGYPIEQLRLLVALNGELIRRSSDETDDKLLEATNRIREQLMLMEAPAPSDAEYDEPQSTEEESGE